MTSRDSKSVLKSLERRFELGEVIFREGEESRELYILLEGHIDIKKNDQVIATVKEPDTYLGEMSTLLGVARTATLIAASDCRMIRVPENKVHDFFAHSPALGIKLAKVLAQRLQEMNIKYEKLVSGQLSETETRKIFQQLTSTGAHRKMLDYYRLNLGNEINVKDIVGELEVSLTDANTILMDFSKAGLIEISGRTLEFLDTRNRLLREMIINWEMQR